VRCPSNLRDVPLLLAVMLAGCGSKPAPVPVAPVDRCWGLSQWYVQQESGGTILLLKFKLLPKEATE